MIKNRFTAFITAVLILMSLSGCTGNSDEGIENANTLPTVSSRETSTDFTEIETETETETITETEETSFKPETTSRERSTELATTTTPIETITLAPDTGSISISDYPTATGTVSEQLNEITVSRITVPEIDDTFGTVTSKPISKLSPYTAKPEITRPYSYYQMSSTQQYIYDKIISAAKKYEQNITFDLSKKITVSDLYFVYQTLFIDQPDIFYLDATIQYLSNSSGYISKMYLEYLITQKEAEMLLSKTDAAAKKIIAKITSSMSEYDIVKLFHDELVKKCNYNETAEHSIDIYGCLVDGQALCQGYARAFVYLCNKMGIQALLISGTAGNEPHMWNMVNIDGDWYHIDLTWDDANKSEYPNFVRYDYFCVTDSFINRIRKVDSQFYSYPKATADKCNYYVYNGYVANSAEEAEQLLKTAAYNASVNKDSAAQIICSSKDVYDEASERLFNQTNGTALSILESVYDKAPNKFDTESLVYNKSSVTYTLKILLDYTN